MAPDERRAPVKRSVLEMLGRPAGAVMARRRMVAIGIGVLAVFFAGYLLGGWRIGGEQSEPRELRRELGLLREENRAASEQLIRLETAQRIDREAYAQIEEQLVQLQDKIIEQQEELAFYRGIVGGPGQNGLSIREFSLTEADAGAVRLRFVLAQLKQLEREVRGQLQVRVEGSRAGRPVSLDATSLAASGKVARLAFGFRYFQDISLDLRLPEDFAAQRVIVRILPTTRGVQNSVESFPWTVRSR